MSFIDEVKIFIRSGNGGRGAVSLHRARANPTGGPDGGNGGKGGDIYIRANKNINTLVNYRFKRRYIAENGQNGSNSQRTGKGGKDLYLDLPIGTNIIDTQTNITLFSLKKDKEEFLLARGGRGGVGNNAFKSSTNQKPMIASQNEQGDEGEYLLKLKLHSDIVFIGLPNSGKTTLASQLANLKLSGSHYKFLTKEPCYYAIELNYKILNILDIPSIVTDFRDTKNLKHIENTNVICYILDGSSNIQKQYNLLQNEIKKYDKKLLEKKQISVITKSDLIKSEKYKPNDKFLTSCYNEEVIKNLKKTLFDLS